MWLAYQFAGLFGIAISSVGMMSLTGLIVAMDAYGPIIDNAGGIAEMAKMPVAKRKVLNNHSSILEVGTVGGQLNKT